VLAEVLAELVLAAALVVVLAVALVLALVPELELASELASAELALEELALEEEQELVRECHYHHHNSPYSCQGYRNMPCLPCRCISTRKNHHPSTTSCTCRLAEILSLLPHTCSTPHKDTGL